MPREEEPVVIPLEVDFSGFQSAMGELEKSSKRFAGAFGGSLRSAIRSGASFEDMLMSMALRISDIGLQTGLRPLENAVGGFLGSAVSGLTGSLNGVNTSSRFDLTSILGSAFSSPASQAISTGVQGVSRGFQASPSNAQSPISPTNVTFNVSTPDVEGFRKSQTQISTLLARSVNRSRRGL